MQVVDVRSKEREIGQISGLESFNRHSQIYSEFLIAYLKPSWNTYALVLEIINMKLTGVLLDSKRKKAELWHTIQKQHELVPAVWVLPREEGGFRSWCGKSHLVVWYGEGWWHAPPYSPMGQIPRIQIQTGSLLLAMETFSLALFLPLGEARWGLMFQSSGSKSYWIALPTQWLLCLYTPFFFSKRFRYLPQDPLVLMMETGSEPEIQFDTWVK